MLTVNIEQLISAIQKADGFEIPDMNAGTDYLYNKLYRRLILSIMVDTN